MAKCQLRGHTKRARDKNPWRFESVLKCSTPGSRLQSFQTVDLMKPSILTLSESHFFSNDSIFKEYVANFECKSSITLLSKDFLRIINWGHLVHLA